MLSINLNLKGLKNFEKKVFEIMEDKNLLYDNLYRCEYNDNENTTESIFFINMITKKGNSIGLHLYEFKDYEDNRTNYKYKLFIYPITEPPREINVLSPIDLIEALISVTSTL